VAALPGWVERSVLARIVAFRGSASRGEQDDAAALGRQVADLAGPRLRQLLTTDVDAQTTTPLEVIRGSLGPPTDALRRMGVPVVVRDEFDRGQFPDDDYDLVPRSFADIDPALLEPGLTWGAAKAHVHLRRRRTAGPGSGPGAVPD
jgi:hypothetical protein